MPNQRPDSRRARIVKRVLKLSFLFFLLKGIAWLGLGWLAWTQVD